MPSPDAWLALAFICSLGALAYLAARRRMIDRLDQYQDRIRGELHEAIRLREDVQALLSELQTKALAADSEAEAVIGGARVEAERFTAEARLHLEQMVALRTRIAEAKIAQAEVQALAEVRGAAAGAAGAVAEKSLRNQVMSDSKSSLLSRRIRDARLTLTGGRSRAGSAR